MCSWINSSVKFSSTFLFLVQFFRSRIHQTSLRRGIFGRRIEGMSKAMTQLFYDDQQSKTFFSLNETIKRKWWKQPLPAIWSILMFVQLTIVFQTSNCFSQFLTFVYPHYWKKSPTEWQLWLFDATGKIKFNLLTCRVPVISFELNSFDNLFMEFHKKRSKWGIKVENCFIIWLNNFVIIIGYSVKTMKFWFMLRLRNCEQHKYLVTSWGTHPVWDVSW